MEGIPGGIVDPLQTPLILDCIFKNLDRDDLQECGLVCRTWRHESRKAMRAIAKVEIECDDLIRRGPSKFLELVQNDQSSFFQAPFADTFELSNGVADCPEFWETCGAHIKFLRLQDVTFSSADTFRHAVFRCSPNLQKLHIVKLKVLGEPAPEPKDWVPTQFTPNRDFKTLSICDPLTEFSIGWLEILSNFPCLEKLVLADMREQCEDVFRALQVARQHDASSWNLKEVELRGGLPAITVPPSFVRVFCAGDLALTCLSIEGIAGDTEEEVTAIQKLVDAHADSLKKLAISQICEECPEPDIFPLPGNKVLENVEVLEVSKFEMRSTRFLQTFQSLKKLLLDVHDILEDIRTPEVTLESCTELILRNHMIETDDFKLLFGLLPNLKMLKIYNLDNERFSLICENWPDLTHLELVVGQGDCEMEVDNAGISGYDRKDVRKINKRRRRRPWRPITVRRANLSSLKNLRSFHWMLTSEASSKVGYCSEACGILELPQLKHLLVEDEDGDGFKENSVQMFKSLSERFPWDRSQRITFD